MAQNEDEVLKQSQQAPEGLLRVEKGKPVKQKNIAAGKIEGIEGANSRVVIVCPWGNQEGNQRDVVFSSGREPDVQKRDEGKIGPHGFGQAVRFQSGKTDWGDWEMFREPAMIVRKGDMYEIQANPIDTNKEINPNFDAKVYAYTNPTEGLKQVGLQYCDGENNMANLARGEYAFIDFSGPIDHGIIHLTDGNNVKIFKKRGIMAVQIVDHEGKPSPQDPQVYELTPNTVVPFGDMAEIVYNQQNHIVFACASKKEIARRISLETVTQASQVVGRVEESAATTEKVLQGLAQAEPGTIASSDLVRNAINNFEKKNGLLSQSIKEYKIGQIADITKSSGLAFDMEQLRDGQKIQMVCGKKKLALERKGQTFLIIDDKGKRLGQINNGMNLLGRRNPIGEEKGYIQITENQNDTSEVVSANHIRIYYDQEKKIFYFIDGNMPSLQEGQEHKGKPSSVGTRIGSWEGTPQTPLSENLQGAGQLRIGPEQLVSPTSQARQEVHGTKIPESRLQTMLVNNMLGVLSPDGQKYLREAIDGKDFLTRLTHYFDWINAQQSTPEIETLRRTQEQLRGPIISKIMELGLEHNINLMSQITGPILANGQPVALSELVRTYQDAYLEILKNEPEQQSQYPPSSVEKALKTRLQEISGIPEGRKRLTDSNILHLTGRYFMRAMQVGFLDVLGQQRGLLISNLRFIKSPRINEFDGPDGNMGELVRAKGGPEAFLKSLTDAYMDAYEAEQKKNP